MLKHSEHSLMKKIHAFLKEAVPHLSLISAEVIRLTEGGSDRIFYRITSSGQSIVVMTSTSPRFDIQSYIDVDAFLSRYGIGVPEIIAYDEAAHIAILEDLGDESLYVLLRKAQSEQEKVSRYRDVLQVLIEMQVKTAGHLESCGYLRGRGFGYEALRWETDYFTECFIRRYCGIERADDAELDREFHRLAAALAEEPRYFMHRDFQSQNIYFKEGRVRVIDFQTATKGLLQYDLVSLLKDAYCPLEEHVRNELLNYYLKMIEAARGEAVDRETFVKTFHRTGLQRTMQALGAFAYLSMDRKKKAFEAHIPNALLYLKEALQEENTFPVLKELIHRADAVIKRKRKDSKTSPQTPV